MDSDIKTLVKDAHYEDDTLEGVQNQALERKKKEDEVVSHRINTKKYQDRFFIMNIPSLE